MCVLGYLLPYRLFPGAPSAFWIIGAFLSFLVFFGRLDGSYLVRHWPMLPIMSTSSGFFLLLLRYSFPSSERFSSITFAGKCFLYFLWILRSRFPSVFERFSLVGIFAWSVLVALLVVVAIMLASSFAVCFSGGAGVLHLLFVFFSSKVVIVMGAHLPCSPSFPIGFFHALVVTELHTFSYINFAFRFGLCRVFNDRRTGGSPQS